VRDADDTPALQLAQAVADVRTGDAQGSRELLGVQGLWREIENGMDLRYCAIDSPSRPHFSPMQDEALLDRRESCVSHFC